MPHSDNAPAPSSQSDAPLAPVAKGAPIFGNTFQFLEDTTGLLLRSYRELGPVYRLRALWLKYTVIGGFEAREFMRLGLDDQYLTREAVFAEVGRQLGSADFVLGQSGEKHTRFRKLLSLAYSREVASPWVPELIAAVREHIRGWQPGSVVGVMDQVQQLAFEQYCQVMCGRSLKAHYRDCLRVTDYNMNVGGRVWPFFMYRMPWYRASRQRVLDLMWGMVRERHARGLQPGEKATIMDTLMSLRDSQGQSLTDDEVVCYSMYGFAGSCSYMGRAIGFLLYELLQHPDLLADVTAEVDQAFAGGLKDAADVRSLKLLQAVYHESLRFHPVSQGMPHLAAKDFVYLGKKVQKGDLTVLSQVPMSFSMCPFANPEKFDPSRCLEPRNEHKKENAFHPFGIGHRMCTAAGLVELMSLTMVATLIHELRFTCSPPNYRLKLKVRPLPAPDDNFGLRIEARRSEADRRKPMPVSIEEHVVASVNGHEDPKVHALLERAQSVHYAPGAVIIREGDDADAFYILADGSVTVSRQVEGRPQLLATLGEGDYFGEIGLLQHTQRTATVTAAGTGAQVLKLDYDAFEELVVTSDLLSSDLARLLQKRLASQRLVEALPGLSSAAAQQILPEFTPRGFAAGITILQEGERADRFYVLLDGEVVVSRRQAGGDPVTVATLRPGQYFGEVGLLTGLPRNASVTAGRMPVVVLETDRDGFFSLLEETGGLRGNLAQAMMRRLAAHMPR
jgi:CRP-like cAMP-binding protein/cytochrome P450